MSLPSRSPLEPGRLPGALLLAGPTAVGKSAVALALAGRLGGEIVSVDSMQVYRGMDIGTAKPSPAERQRVPHHLLDVADLDEPFDAARFLDLARRAVADIRARGRLPILCGGTGLYFKAYREGLAEMPPADAALRRELEVTPLEALLRELESRDPVAGRQIDRRNPRRVIRAVEVIRLTGRPFSEQRSGWGGPALEQGLAEPMLVLHRPGADLQRRIHERVDQMFQRGLVEETRALLERGLERNRTAFQGLGYRQVADHLKGLASLAETVERVKARTRQFARRQLTWFRHQARASWVRLESDRAPEEEAEQILLALGGPP